MNKTKKLLSIVIPVYQRHEHLKQLLRDLSTSIINNDLYYLVSVVVVDDGSPNSCGLIEDNDFVTQLKNKKNMGAPYSRYEGFKSTDAEFIHFHDSDDLISEHWLSKLIDTLQNTPNIDILLTARDDIDEYKDTYKLQQYFNKNCSNRKKIENRLIYRNCMGPLGGVTFSRRVLEEIQFKNFASCQDWQMYIDAIKYSKVLVSRPDIKFIFNKTGDDRISHNPRKKILGHLQLSRITSKESIFKRNIRLFYLYTCKKHIYNKGGSILKFYKKNRFKIFATFLVVSLYWRLT